MLIILDKGEVRHVQLDIVNIRGDDFSVTAGSYMFIDPAGKMISEGAVHIIDGRTLDVVIEPPVCGDHRLIYTYYIADEKLIDEVKVVVI